MNIYLRVYAQALKINVTKLLVYRSSLIYGMIISVVWGGFMLISMLLLTTKISTIAGWDRLDLLVLASMYNVVVGLFYVFFAYNFRDLSQIIHQGRLDLYLLKPLDSQFLVSTLMINFPNLVRCLAGVAATAVLLGIMHAPVTLGSLLLAGLMTLVSMLLFYSVWFILSTLLIWYSNLSNLIDILYLTTGFGRFPREVLQFAPLVLTLLIPFFLTVSVPTKILLGKGSWTEVALLTILACSAFMVSRWFWKYALRSYVGGSV